MSDNLRHLPARLKNRPDVRALSLRVYETDHPARFQVPGRSKIYDVWYVGGQLHCNCVAATFGNHCAHALAVEHHLNKQREEA